MLYPLSYEGACVVRLPSMAAGLGPSGLGLAASLQTVCAAPVPRAVYQLIHHRPDPRRRLYGGMVPSQEPEAAEQRGNDGGCCWLRLPLAVVMLVGSMGANWLCHFWGKIANGKKPDFS